MEDIKLTKSLKKQEYMRNYMNNYYHKHQEDANSKCLGRYYKKKRNIAQEDLDLFKEHIATVVKAKECLEKVKKECPQFLTTLFETYKLEAVE